MHQTLASSPIKILDIPVTPLKLPEIISQIDRWIEADLKNKIIGHSNLHGLYTSIYDPGIRHFYKKCDINYIDGLPLVWIANKSGSQLTSDNRITFLDVAANFIKHCEINTYKVLWIGGTEESIDQGIKNLLSKTPKADLVGVNGFKSDSEYIEKINSLKPNVIILGLGMPLQEQWVLRNIDKINTNVIWCVGATIDYISGKIYSPPRWSGPIGLEWLFRLLSEPKRMFPRYVLEPFVVLFHLLIKRQRSK